MYESYLSDLDAEAGLPQDLCDEINIHEMDDEIMSTYVTELYLGEPTAESTSAMHDEIGKMREFGVFDMMPLDLRSVRRRDDERPASSRVVGVKGIVTIKNVEESSDKHEYKARIVATGNFVRDRYLHKVPDWSMWSPTASMQGMRFVCAQAAITGHNLESIDLRSAYLQAPLEEEEGEWYVLFDTNAIS